MKILIIDDDQDICSLLCRYLIKHGFQAESAITAHAGVSKFKEGGFEIVFCDYKLGDKNGKDVMLEIKTINPLVVVIIITGYSHIKTAVEVIKAGAFDYISKPLIPEEVLNLVSTASSQLVRVPQPVAKQVIKTRTLNLGNEYFIGTSHKIAELYKQVDIVAETDYNVILYGETGTGKEVVARTLHQKSLRDQKQFIAIDCGALSQELAGSALFGHIKGSFTGAVNDKEGFFQVAGDGTIFLDEVANLSYDIQATLLRVIQERSFKKIGGVKEIPFNARIIVASNENLQEAVRKGRFREDLYFRFNEFSINIPPLRELKIDIPDFAQYFLNKTNNELNKKINGFEENVLNVFQRYPWPGNVREFRNVIRRAVLLTKSGKVDMNVLPVELTGHVKTDIPEPKDPDLKNAALNAEYEKIMKVLTEVKFNKTKAAEVLNIDRKTLYNKIWTYEQMVNSNALKLENNI